MELKLKFASLFNGAQQEQEIVECKDIRHPVFLPKSGVAGTLEITKVENDLLGAQDTRIEISLEGLMRIELETRVGCRQGLRVVSQKKLVAMTQAMSVRHHTRGASDQVRQYPFHFDLQSWIAQRQAQSVEQSALSCKTDFTYIPPSLQHEVFTTPAGVQRPRAGARVSYKVTARVLRGSQTVQKVVEPVLISLPACPAPPMCLSDFSEEYREKQESVLRGALFRRPGTLSVIVQGAHALTLRKETNSAVLNLPIGLQIEQSIQGAGLANMPCIEAEVKWQLRISTFVSLKEKSGPVTLKEATISPTSGHVRSAFKSRTAKLCWERWRMDTENTSDDKVVSRSERCLTIAIPRSEVLTPTFWTTFLCRRYSIWLQVNVTKPGTASIEVEVPVQVGVDISSAKVYRDELSLQRSRDNSLMIDGTDGDELLPRYECLE